MGLMTKYEYTYFIYPYAIHKNSYKSYIHKLLKDKNCVLRVFEKEKDMHLYHYFLPDIRNFMFWSFEKDKKEMKKFNELDIASKANILANNECTIFKYKLPQNLQGKIGETNGIFFDISEMKIICFKTGICFLIFKTTLLNEKDFSDILNFNYKFKEINSKTYELKDYENIRIQSDVFKDVQDISQLIKSITIGEIELQKINLDRENMIGYSYCCIDQNSWEEGLESDMVQSIFEKYRLFLPANQQLADPFDSSEDMKLFENKTICYGFSNAGTVLLVTDTHTPNYTIVPQKYESQYLYNYVLELYKKLLLKKLSHDFNQSFSIKKGEEEFIEFTKKLWVQEVTDDEFGKKLTSMWHKNLGTEEIFSKLKSKYDILYKKYNIEKNSNKNGKLGIMMVVLIVIGIINMLLLLGR